MSYIPPSVSANLPTMVRRQIEQLSAERQEEFVEEYRRKSKNTAVAYLLWFVLSLHYAYLGRIGMTVLLWVALFFVVGIFWWLIDIFRIPGMIRNYNSEAAVDILRTMKIVAGDDLRPREVAPTPSPTPTGQSFCTQCGTAVSGARFCPGCGREVPAK